MMIFFLLRGENYFPGLPTVNDLINAHSIYSNLLEMGH